MPQPTFDYVFKEWAGPTDFEVELLRTPPIPWAKGVTIHHSVIPTLDQWYKHTPQQNLDGMAHYYQYEVDDGAGWSAGPHLFIAPDGIYQMTPLAHAGIHATICNKQYWGVEVVGNYDDHYWSSQTEYRVLGVAAALLRKAKATSVTLDTLRGHRECNSPKTCPGKAINMNAVRDKVRKLMGIGIPVLPPVVDNKQVIGVPQSVTYDQWATYLRKNGVQMADVETRFVYDTCVRLEVDAAFIAAMWKQASFEDDPNTSEVVAVMGGGTLQRQTHAPINIVEPASATRDKVPYKGKFWRAWEAWQLGLIDAVLYFKQEYGAHGLLTVDQIIDVYAPPSENDTVTYKQNVKKRMGDMAAP